MNVVNFDYNGTNAKRQKLTKKEVERERTIRGKNSAGEEVAVTFVDTVLEDEREEWIDYQANVIFSLECD